mgnify:FL=1
MLATVDVCEALRVAVLVGTARGCLDAIDLAAVEIALCRPGLAEDASQHWTRVFLPMLAEQVSQNDVPFEATSWRAIFRRAHNPDAKLAMGAGCGFRVDQGGVLWSWGENLLMLGDLASGSTAERRIPRPLKFTSHKITAISVVDTYAIACDESGAVWTWGENLHIQRSLDVLNVGHFGTVFPSHHPTRVPGFGVETSNNFAVSVSAGVDHSVVIDAAGGCLAWGSNMFGQCGRWVKQIDDEFPVSKPTRVDALLPQPLNVVQACAGKSSTVLLDEQGVLWRCFSNAASVGSWVERSSLPLPSKPHGDTRETNKHKPCVKVLSDARSQVVTHVSMAHEEMLFINSTGVAYAGGRSSGGFGFRPEPIPGRVRRGVTSTFHMLLLSTDGRVYGAGRNTSHELDCKASGWCEEPVPIPLGGDCKVVAVQCGTSLKNRSPGNLHTDTVAVSAAILEDGRMLTWGAPRAWLGRGGADDMWTLGSEPETVRF